MRARILYVGFLTALSLLPAEKKLPLEQTSNELVEISATAVVDREQVRQEMGYDLGAGIIVVRVRVRPVSDKPVNVVHDDFLLISGRDGQRSQPFEPSQIAGNSTLVVSSTGVRNGGMMGQGNGPVWGGIPGAGGIPRRLPGNGGAVGSTGETSAAEAKVESQESGRTNPVLAVLKQKILPEKEITQPISGLLYFQIEGKLKTKDLELHYKTPSGQISLRFRDANGK